MMLEPVKRGIKGTQRVAENHKEDEFYLVLPVPENSLIIYGPVCILSTKFPLRSYDGDLYIVAAF